MDYIAMGKGIRELRKTKGLSQKELAQKVGISKSYMSCIETGKGKLRLSVLAALADAFGVRAADLVFIGEEKFQRDENIKINLQLADCKPEYLRFISDFIKAFSASAKSIDAQVKQNGLCQNE